METKSNQRRADDAHAERGFNLEVSLLHETQSKWIVCACVRVEPYGLLRWVRVREPARLMLTSRSRTLWMIHRLELGYCLLRTLITRQTTGSSALFLGISWSGETRQQRDEDVRARRQRRRRIARQRVGALSPPSTIRKWRGRRPSVKDRR